MAGNTGGQSAADDEAETFRQAEEAARRRRDATAAATLADDGVPLGPMGGQSIGAPAPPAKPTPKPGDEYTDEQKDQIVAMGGTPEKASLGGFRFPGQAPAGTPPEMMARPAGTPLKTSVERMNEAAAANAPPALPPRAAPGPVGGGGGMAIIPGGWQYEHAKLGKSPAPAALQAYDDADALEMEAAEGHRNADAAYYAHVKGLAEAQYAAEQGAANAHADVQQRRDAEVRSRIDEIESMNAELQKGIDPEHFWTSRPAWARVLGAISIGLGSVGGGQNPALAIIESAIDRDMDAQRSNLGRKQKIIGNKMDILNLHKERLKNEDAAIEATRLGYYDATLRQLDAFKAEHGIADNDPRYMEMKADILKNRGNTLNKLWYMGQAEITASYRGPQVVGGGGGQGQGLEDTGNVITLGDGTSWDMGSSDPANKARERIVALQQLSDINARIKQHRATVTGLINKGAGHTDPEYMAEMKTLEDLEGLKIPLWSKATDGSVVREGEREAIGKANIGATEGLGHTAIVARGVPKLDDYMKGVRGATDRMLDQQSDQFMHMQRQEASAAAGKQVERGYVRNAQGNLEPRIRYQGVNAKPTEFRPSPTFRDDRGRSRYSSERKLSEDFDEAPDYGSVGTSATAGAGGGKRSHHRK
jgi:hypothetical protein